MADKLAIRKMEMGDDGKLKTVYYDAKTKKRLTSLKGYKVKESSTSGETETPTKTDKTKGFAVPVIIRGEDGLNKTIYVDPTTGAQVTDLDKREVKDQFTSNLDELGLKPKEPEKEKSTKTPQKEELSDAQKYFKVDDRRHDQNHPYGGGEKRKASNNYGYVDKPGILSMAGLMPGPLGMMGKAANLAINANNVQAVKQGREALGFDKKANPMGYLRDQKGYVGELTYDKEDASGKGVTSPVGFEALTKDGRTTLTVEEARRREALAGGTEATKEEKKGNIRAFKAENPRGLLSKVFGGVKDAINGAEVKEDTKRENKVSDGPKTTNVVDPDLPSRQMSDLEYNMGARSEIPSSGIDKKVQDVVTDTLGPGYSVELYSGQEPEGRSPVGTPHRHPNGFAGDFHIKDPDGRTLDLANPEDERAMRAVATNMAGRYGANIGAGKGYMAGTGMHIDTMPLGGQYPGGPVWGKSAAGPWANDLQKARELGVMDPSYYDVKAPTPTFRPEPDVVGQNDVPTIGPATAHTTVDLSRATSFSPEAKALMARTVAGEIDPRYTDLTTPEGVKEAQGIMSTMENRAKDGDIVGAISKPNAYSTWNNPEAAAIANANYAANPGMFDGLVESYAKDPSKNLGFTNYYNPATASPSWGPKMVNTTTVGPHQFGALPEYGSFGKNFGKSAMTEKNLQTPTPGPQPVSYGTQAKGFATANMKSPAATLSTSNGLSGSVSDENANRATSESTSRGLSSSTNRGDSGFGYGGDRSSEGKSSYGGSNRGNPSSGLSTSPGSGGGFGVGGDRSSEGKSSYGGSGLSTSKGSGGGFGVGGDRSSEGKSSYGGSGTGTGMRDNENKGGYGSNNTNSFGGPR